MTYRPAFQVQRSPQAMFLDVLTGEFEPDPATVVELRVLLSRRGDVLSVGDDVPFGEGPPVVIVACAACGAQLVGHVIAGPSCARCGLSEDVCYCDPVGA